MKKTLIARYIALAVAGVILLTGCTSSHMSQSQAVTSSSSLSSSAATGQNESAKSISSEEQSSLENNHDVYGMPFMSDERQKTYDKYIKPLVSVSPLLIYPFDKDEFSGAFQAAEVYSSLANILVDGWAQDTVVEDFVRQYFEIAPEEMRSLSKISSYNSDTSTYYVPAVPRTNLPRYRGIVTDSVTCGDTLTVTTDWYEADSTGTFYPKNKMTTSVTHILILGDNMWRYSSNQSSLIFDETRAYYDDIYETYLHAVDESVMMSYSWERANQIDQDDLAMYYYYSVLLVANPYGWRPAPEVPSQEYEAYILQHFKTTAEHLRKSSNYNSAKDVYEFKDGVGGSGRTDVLSVAQSGNYLDITYLQHDLGDNPIRKGTIRVAVTGEQWDYISCSVSDLN